jgi:hypothetical protein
LKVLMNGAHVNAVMCKRLFEMYPGAFCEDMENGNLVMIDHDLRLQSCFVIISVPLLASISPIGCSMAMAMAVPNASLVVFVGWNGSNGQ